MTQPNYPPGDPNAYPPGQYPPGQYPPQFYVQPRKTNGLAIASMIVSILSLTSCCGPVGVVGAILGHKAKGQIAQTGEEGEGMATAGVIVGWISFGLFLVVAIGYGIIIAIAAADGAFDSGTSSGY
jgi:hypothetical protein